MSGSLLLPLPSIPRQVTPPLVLFQTCVQLPLWTKGQYISVRGVDVMEGSSFLRTSGANCPSLGYCTW
jgi:hypothetical protein